VRVRVTDQGVLIPRELLDGADEVEIHQQNGVIVVMPAGAPDPILGLGQNPVTLDVTDASVNLDRYLYGRE
jgi:virulence-associated protein VagC